MGTDITVTRTDYVSENRSWLQGPHGTEPGTTPSITLDLALFSDAKFADVIKSGCALAKVTATGLFGPYTAGASNGLETARALLFNTISRKPGQTRVADAGYIHGFVNDDKLPYTSGVGSLDADGKTDLKLIAFVGDLI